MKYIINQLVGPRSYRVTVTEDIGEVISLKRQAAVGARLYAEREASHQHLVYYYEKAHGDKTTVWMSGIPVPMTDDEFYGRFDRMKPDYVGAIHRR